MAAVAQHATSYSWSARLPKWSWTLGAEVEGMRRMDGPTYVDFVEFHKFELGGKSGKTSFVEGDGVVIVYFYGETR